MILSMIYNAFIHLYHTYIMTKSGTYIQANIIQIHGKDILTYIRDKTGKRGYFLSYLKVGIL